MSDVIVEAIQLLEFVPGRKYLIGLRLNDEPAFDLDMVELITAELKNIVSELGLSGDVVFLVMRGVEFVQPLTQEDTAV